MNIILIFIIKINYKIVNLIFFNKILFVNQLKKYLAPIKKYPISQLYNFDIILQKIFKQLFLIK